jgi:hypothetical protein
MSNIKRGRGKTKPNENGRVPRIITLEKEGGKIRNETQITRLLSLRNSTKKGNSYEENHRWMHCTHMHYTLSLKSSTIPTQRQSAGVG